MTKKNVDADKTPGETWNTGMEKYDGTNCDGTQSVNITAVTHRLPEVNWLYRAQLNNSAYAKQSALIYRCNVKQDIGQKTAHRKLRTDAVWTQPALRPPTNSHQSGGPRMHR